MIGGLTPAMEPTMTNTQTTEPMQDPVDDLAADDGAAHAQIEILKAELEQLRAQSLRDRADIENQRRRLERDVRNAVRFANKQLLGDLLPILDSMEAALVTADAADPLRDGVVLTCASDGSPQPRPSGVARPATAFDPDKHQP